MQSALASQKFFLASASAATSSDVGVGAGVAVTVGSAGAGGAATLASVPARIFQRAASILLASSASILAIPHRFYMNLQI